MIDAICDVMLICFEAMMLLRGWTSSKDRSLPCVIAHILLEQGVLVSTTGGYWLQSYSRGDLSVGGQVIYETRDT
jgi:hypothetical protein